jgi:hypothetical protein
VLLVVVLLLGLGLIGSALGWGDDETGSGGVNPDEQDPACHSGALAIASRQPGFVWNGQGMSRYHREYEACLQAAEVFGD